MTHIEETNRLYELLRHYGCWLHRICYRHYVVTGRENLPTDGAVILAPNHSNALQDAISVVDAVQHSVVFVGRAAMFKQAWLARICRFMKILPINRIRDGIGEVRKNDETIEETIRILRTGQPFAIFAEGTMRSKHSLLPLVKGIFRIALQTDERMRAEGTRKPVYIVPIGIDYDDYFHFGDDVHVQIGEPINVSQFVDEHSQLSQPQTMNALRQELTARLQSLIRYIPDDANYEAAWELLTGKATQPIRHGLPGVEDHGFDQTFKYMFIFVMGILSLGLFLPIAWLCIHLLATIRRLCHYRPAYQELI